jgi:Na+/phosphate symporter
MAGEQLAKEQVEIIGSMVDKLLTMMGAARDAFNRHSRDRLEELKNLTIDVAQGIRAAVKETQAQAAKKSEAERVGWARLQSILIRLEIIGETIGGLVEPIKKKIQAGVLFSDKAVSQTNYLFDQQAGMLRSLLDIVKTDNEFLKKYVLDLGRSLIQSCSDFATEHEARMIEGLCLPQAAPLFLAILDRIRTIIQHEMEIANLLAK